jgi:hypothetical protein
MDRIKPKDLNAEPPGRTDIDDSDQAADTRKPSDTGQAGLSDKSGMLNEGDINRREPPL